MPAPVGSLFATHSNRIREMLNNAIEVYMPALDMFWKDSVLTSGGVKQTDDFGRDWKMIKIFMGSLAGVIEPGGPRDDFVLYGDAGDTALGPKVHTKSVVNTFPDPFKGANPTPYRLGVGLRTMVSNLALTLGEMQADATPALVGQVVVPKLEGHARNWALMLCNYFFLSQNNYYAVSYLDGGSGTGWDKTVDTNTTLKVDLTYSNYTVDRFAVGMLFQVYNSAGTTLRQTASLGANTVFMCTRVDETTCTVYFKAIDGLDLSGAAFADDDIIVFANSKGSASTPYAASPYFTGIAGIRSWLRSGDESSPSAAANFLLGAERDTANEINVLEHPEFRSLEKSLAGAPLTEGYLRRLVHRWHAAKNKYGQSIDRFTASDGVWLAYQSQRTGREYWDRGSALPPAGPQGLGNKSMEDAGFRVVVDGKSYKCETSQFIESGTVYGTKSSGQNWKRYAPPTYKGLKKDPKQMAAIPFEFVGGALRGDGIHQMPYYKTDANGGSLTTEAVTMPGMLRMQICPDQPTGIILTNVQEERLYND